MAAHASRAADERRVIRVMRELYRDMRMVSRRYSGITQVSPGYACNGSGDRRSRLGCWLTLGRSVGSLLRCERHHANTRAPVGVQNSWPCYSMDMSNSAF